MRRMLTLVLGLALGLPLLAGCHLLNNTRGRDNVNLPAQSTSKADAASLVNYLNLNARKVQSVQAAVDIDAKMGGQALGLSGALAARGPRDFRLRGKVVGRPVVDIGSNEERFWYWISEAKPAHYYFCSYKDLGSGKVNVPFPIETDMVMAALGMSEYDPKAKYEVKQTAGTIEMQQDTVSASGQAVKRVTVFRSTLAARPGDPQVLEHQLRDAKGGLICRASVQKVQKDDPTGAVIPKTVLIEYPAQKVSMKLMLSDLQVNRIDQESAGRMFTLSGTTGHDLYDLARNAVVTPSSFRRATADMPLR